MTIKPGDTPARCAVPRDGGRRAHGQHHQPTLQGPQGRAFRGAGRLHADLPQEPPARLSLTNRDEILAKGIDAIAVTAVNDVFVMDSLGQGSNGAPAHRVARRRQWRLCPGDRSGARLDRRRHGHALAALLDDRRGSEREFEGAEMSRRRFGMLEDLRGAAARLFTGAFIASGGGSS